MIINHNMMAMNMYRNMKINSFVQARAIERLSSGMRINRASDDAAGLAISEKMRGQIRGLNQASRNAQDGISAIQVADGALNETHAILQRMRELSVQASNGTYTDEDRLKINEEITQLKEEIDSIADRTQFNKKKLLNGTLDPTSTPPGKKMNLQIGANAGETLEIEIRSMKLSEIKGADDIKTDTRENAEKSIGSIEEAIKNVSMERSRLGAYQNRLEHTIKNLDTTAENLQAAESRIRDADMAKEMMVFAKANILNQVHMALMAQVNQQPQLILQLLR